MICFVCGDGIKKTEEYFRLPESTKHPVMFRHDACGPTTPNWNKIRKGKSELIDLYLKVESKRKKKDLSPLKFLGGMVKYILYLINKQDKFRVFFFVCIEYEGKTLTSVKYINDDCAFIIDEDDQKLRIKNKNKEKEK